ncbi:MAG: AroB-related putative sugar phosphate phospholyase (cyclizing) [Syntrophorhabdaceae bacterium]
MFEPMTIRSHKGPYTVFFDDGCLAALNRDIDNTCHVIVDRRFADLYAADMDRVLGAGSVLIIEATEDNKSLHKFPGYVEHLVSRSVRRGQKLIAIGGGVIQDITCFLAATVLRGLPWHFYPTTLLAQADSCIGSKSSINAGKTKNILGTYTPPEEVHIDVKVLNTLAKRELHSGIGEMLKVHAIEGPESYDTISRDYPALFLDHNIRERYIYRSLAIKKPIIELDEFDTGPRNVMNYGHSFGHAIESATDFAIPHGVAVSIGMDMANFISSRLDITNTGHYARMHGILRENSRGFDNVDVAEDQFMCAIAKDKKNTGTHLKVVLPGRDGHISVHLLENDRRFRELCGEFLKKRRFQ